MAHSLTALTRRALRRMPGSLRALARAAGVPSTTLARIRSGHLRASPMVARRVAGVLARWSEWCGWTAARLRVAERHRK